MTSKIPQHEVYRAQYQQANVEFDRKQVSDLAKNNYSININETQIKLTSGIIKRPDPAKVFGYFHAVADSINGDFSAEDLKMMTEAVKAQAERFKLKPGQMDQEKILEKLQNRREATVQKETEAKQREIEAKKIAEMERKCFSAIPHEAIAQAEKTGGLRRDVFDFSETRKSLINMGNSKMFIRASSETPGNLVIAYNKIGGTTKGESRIIMYLPQELHIKYNKDNGKWHCCDPKKEMSKAGPDFDNLEELIKAQEVLKGKEFSIPKKVKT